MREDVILNQIYIAFAKYLFVIIRGNKTYFNLLYGAEYSQNMRIYSKNRENTIQAIDDIIKIKTG